MKNKYEQQKEAKHLYSACFPTLNILDSKGNQTALLDSLAEVLPDNISLVYRTINQKFKESEIGQVFEHKGGLFVKSLYYFNNG